jgi:hypothetical protein
MTPYQKMYARLTVLLIGGVAIPTTLLMIFVSTWFFFLFFAIPVFAPAFSLEVTNPTFVSVSREKLRRAHVFRVVSYGNGTYAVEARWWLQWFPFRVYSHLDIAQDALIELTAPKIEWSGKPTRRGR